MHSLQTSLFLFTCCSAQPCTLFWLRNHSTELVLRDFPVALPAIPELPPRRATLPPQWADCKELTDPSLAALRVHRESQDSWNKLFSATTGISSLVGSGGILWGILQSAEGQCILQSSCCLPFGIY